MRINEIFYSLQGEGHYTGTPAVFIRLAGCNLRCWFCDTEFTTYREMTDQEILDEVKQYPCRHIVITGGEPTLQLTPSLTTLLHSHGYYLMLETNGTTPLAPGCEIDWITCSPKRKAQNSAEYHPVRLAHIDELKVVFDGETQALPALLQIPASEYRLQPCSTKDTVRDRAIQQATVDYILQHPEWRLSLQTHLLLEIQ